MWVDLKLNISTRLCSWPDSDAAELCWETILNTHAISISSMDHCDTKHALLTWQMSLMSYSTCFQDVCCYTYSHKLSLPAVNLKLVHMWILLCRCTAAVHTALVMLASEGRYYSPWRFIYKQCCLKWLHHPRGVCLQLWGHTLRLWGYNLTCTVVSSFCDIPLQVGSFSTGRRSKKWDPFHFEWPRTQHYTYLSP